MDTSKNYYESVMRDYNTYKRGRSLEQYCRDEGVDFQWLTKAQKMYGEPEDDSRKKKALKQSKNRQPDVPELIRLHYEDDTTGQAVSSTAESAHPEETTRGADSTEAAAWRVSALTVTTPAGHDIEIRGCSPSALMELLARLAV